MRFQRVGSIVVLLCATAALPMAQELSVLLGGPLRWASDTAMHRQFVARFEAAVGLGRARMISPSLHVHDDMQLSLSVAADEDYPATTLRYRLTSLELIGIAH